MEKEIKFKTPDFDKLVGYGFTKKEDKYIISKEIINGDFVLTVEITSKGEISTSVVDSVSSEEYVLYKLDSAEGGFVGAVREAVNEVLNDIVSECFVTEIFKQPMTKLLINYIIEKYGDRPEYLWEKFPDNAVFRRKDNEKWYAAVLTASGDKVGLSGDKKIELIDLRIEPDKLDALVDNINYFRGYHMNKRNWLTISLDGSVSFELLKSFTDQSYLLAKSKK